MKQGGSYDALVKPLVKGLDYLVKWLFKNGMIKESEIVQLKPRELLIEGLAIWAQRRMGKELERYIHEAIDNLLFVVAVRTIWLKERPSLIVNNTYLPIPKRLSKKDSTLQRDIFRRLDVYRLMNAYEDILPKVQQIKKKKWRNPNIQAVAFMEKLPGVPTERARKYCSMKASDIALDYVQRKYALNISSEAVKKQLSTIRKGKASLRILEKIKRQVGEETAAVKT